MQTTKSREAKKQQVILSIYPAKATAQEAREMFVKSVTKKDDGSNSHLQSFLALADFLMTNMKAFTFDDCIANSRGMEIPVPELRTLWTAWTTKMVQLNKLCESPSCYANNLFIVQ